MAFVEVARTARKRSVSPPAKSLARKVVEGSELCSYFSLKREWSKQTIADRQKTENFRAYWHCSRMKVVREANYILLL